MIVSSHTSEYRGVMVTIEKRTEGDGRVSLYATIDDQVFEPMATDSFDSILKECRAQIDYWIDQRRSLHSQRKRDRD